MMMLRSGLFAVSALAAVLGLSACGDSKSGAAQETSGEIKEAAGSIIGDDSLKREGQKDQVVGGVRDAASDVKEAVKDATN